MDRQRLRDQLVRHAYQYADEPRFTLASGRTSHYYVECKKVTTRRDAARSLARLFERYVPKSAHAVGGLTMGADPIAYAMRDLCKKPLDAFMVRKAAKDHGRRRMIEGPVEPGMNVVIVDDVVTTGGSTITAVEECRKAGLNVVAVIVLVDREEDDGLARIKQTVGPDVPVNAVFTRSDLHARWLELQGTPAHRSQTAAG